MLLGAREANLSPRVRIVPRRNQIGARQQLALVNSMGVRIVVRVWSGARVAPRLEAVIADVEFRQAARERPDGPAARRDLRAERPRAEALIGRAKLLARRVA